MEEDREFLFRDWVKPIMESEFQSYVRGCSNIYQLLDWKVYDLLQSLEVPGTENKFEKDKKQILDVWNRVLFEIYEGDITSLKLDMPEVYDIYHDNDFRKFYPEMEDIRKKTCVEWRKEAERRKYIAVYDNEKLIAIGLLEKDNDIYHRYGIEIGYKNTALYKGFVSEGRYHGSGAEYYTNGKIKAEGYWLRGDLAAGVKHNCIVERTAGTLTWNAYEDDFDGSPDCELEFLTQLDENYYDGGMHMLEHEVVESGLDKFYVADYKLVGKESGLFTKMISLEVFLSANYPESLENIKELEEYA